MKVEWLQYFDNKRKESVWYGGELVKIEFDHYVITIGAYGDIRAYINDNYYVDKNNGGNFANYLEEEGIYNDRELYKAIGENRIEFESNNWFEAIIWDTEKKEWVSGIDGVLWDNQLNENDFSWVEDWLKEIMN